MTANTGALVKINAGECSGEQRGYIGMWGYNSGDTVIQMTVPGYFNSIAKDVNIGSYIFVNQPIGTESYIFKVTTKWGVEPVKVTQVDWAHSPEPEPLYPTLHEFAATLITSGTVEDIISCPGVLVGQFVNYSLNGDIEGPGPSAQPQAIAYAEVSAPDVVSVHWRVPPPAGQTANIWLSIHSNVPTP